MVPGNLQKFCFVDWRQFRHWKTGPNLERELHAPSEDGNQYFYAIPERGARQIRKSSSRCQRRQNSIVGKQFLPPLFFLSVDGPEGEHTTNPESTHRGPGFGARFHTALN